MRKVFQGAIAGIVAGACVLAATSEARAANCDTLPKPVYVTGSSASKPFLAGVAGALSGTVTIVYVTGGSCVGVNAIVPGVSGSATQIPAGTATIWEATGAEVSGGCTLAAPVNADVGVSDVFAKSCTGVTTVPATVGDFFGPNQVMTFVVPKASSQNVISAEAAYLLFGFGATAGQVSPWTDPASIFIRNQNSGTQTMLGLAINVPANKWLGNDAGGSSQVLTNVSGASNAEKAIGILATDLADANRDKIKILAYKHYHQYTGFWPDKTATSFDKINVRDGHYPIWGPLHFLALVDGTTHKPAKTEVANLVGYFDGSVTPPASLPLGPGKGTGSLLDLEIAKYDVPQCAMKVQRSTEMGDLAPYTPAAPCGCYFDFKATGATTCTACTSDATCGTGKCRNGYCEAR
jgi:hypothetical protein